MIAQILLILLSLAPFCGAHATPTIVDQVLDQKRPLQVGQITLNANELTWRGLKLYGCSTHAEYCEASSQMLCRELGFKKAAGHEVTRVDDFKATDERLWVIMEKFGQIKMLESRRSYLPKRRYVFQKLSCES